ncbi:hypothetical protein PROFUN_01602 [Planoprotostelium fungivorum]|uniref:Uncharacterized protein n=1 Tax=Planoprotostelium fungivorum TaxID=1890364 RepID=A0A2P6NTU5_9EUKA|nr:hypothetical protein PROFUN_01602 [Planoprotostelium fungivorum]
MWVRKGLTPWFHGVPKVMTRGARQILGRVAGQFSHFFQVERHMTYTLRNMHFAQVRHRFRDQCDIPLESARLIETTPGLPRSGICFHLRLFASEMNANYAKV